MRFIPLLSEPYDNNNAILEIHPGSEEQKLGLWATCSFGCILVLWNGSRLKVEVWTISWDEVGIKSVTYLWRVTATVFWAGNGGTPFGSPSPFDSAKRRHVFYICWGYARIRRYHREVEVRDDDIKMDTFRPGGAENVNKVSTGRALDHSDRDWGWHPLWSNPIREPWSCDEAVPVG